jgi:hypothetical protein
MTRFYYDTEFLENGVTIDLISIGIVHEDGETYYAVSQDADWQKIRRDAWLRRNVLPHLPPEAVWKPRAVIRAQVKRFLLSGPTLPELWAYYSSYDHVALAQLFGKMIDFPEGLPMYTNDLRSLIQWTGMNRLPAQDGEQHDALADAQWVKKAHEFIFEKSIALG